MTPTFTFVDLFSGIGGFRIALENHGGRCLGFSEIDTRATNVYKQNFIDFSNLDEIELGSITGINELPFRADLIVGGVPCQSWSVAGKMRGFEDPRGKLWMDTIRVINLNRPKAFIFENVKGLFDPRNKKNLDLICNSFADLEYKVNTKLLKSYDFGVPQNRERIFIVGIRSNLKGVSNFEFPLPVYERPKLYQFINGMQTAVLFEKKKFSPTEIYGDKIPYSRNRFQTDTELNDFFVFCDTRNGHTTIHSWELVKTTTREKQICETFLRNRRKKKYGPADGNPISLDLLKQLIPKLKQQEMRALIKKNIFRVVPNRGYEFVNSKNSAGINNIYRIYLPQSNIFSTITATGTKDYVALDLISGATPQEYKCNFIRAIIKKKRYRQLSSKEAGALQGFPNNFVHDSSDKFALKQFGNAVSVPVIEHLIDQLKQTGVFIPRGDS